MSEVILILGGTKDAYELAETLTRRLPDARIISSLAGRTKEPAPIAGEVRIGGFGGAKGLARFITENRVTKLIDATHPYAETISQNAGRAAQITGVEFQQLNRRPWQKQDGDNWINVPDLDRANQAIPPGARVFLALGSQYISQFSSRHDVHFVIRMIDEPDKPLAFADYSLQVGKPAEVTQEMAMLEENRISHIVCRNSGGTGAYGKIEAARMLGIEVIMVERNPN